MASTSDLQSSEDPGTSYRRSRGLVEPGEVLRSLIALADSVTQLLGEGCEVVIHDFSHLDASIVHITGNVTGRKVGGPLTDLGLAVLRQGQVPDALIGYTTYTPDGRKLRSTSIFLKDQDGVPFGCVCINVDSSRLPPHHDNRNMAMHVGNGPVETFAHSPQAVIDNIFDRLMAGAQGPVDDLSRQDRLELVQGLDEAGVFSLRGATQIVADLLRVTRATVYTYRRVIRDMSKGKETCDAGSEY